ncbi:hypothetical protein KL949_003388 [Ogataea haglerorum]|nr:hypothetical protein KL913_003209 [Ogataea haglerorum]KAG7717554.1 hypothetical protein KL949_003388 [Ogataea haglerorum]
MPCRNQLKWYRHNFDEDVLPNRPKHSLSYVSFIYHRQLRVLPEQFIADAQPWKASSFNRQVRELKSLVAEKTDGEKSTGLEKTSSTAMVRILIACMMDNANARI